MSSLVFKSEQDREKALSHKSASIPEITDIPADVDIDKFADDLDRELELIVNAAIDPNAPEWQPPAEGGKPAESPSAESHPETTLETTPHAPSNFEIENLRRTADKIRQDAEAELRKRDEELAKYKEETEAKLAALKPKEEQKPVVDPDLIRRIDDKKLELKNIITDLRDKDDMDGDFAKLSKKQAEIQIELQNLKEQRLEAMLEDAREKIKKMSELTTAQQQKFEEDRKAAEEREKSERAENARKEFVKKQFERVESFRNSRDELKSGRPYSEMESDYIDFTNNVAAIYFDKLPQEVSAQERDEAYVKYAKKVPALLEKLQANNIKPPSDLDKYLLLSDVNAIYSGTEFDYNTGEWKPVLNDQGVQVGSSSMEMAYEYYRKKNGITDQQMLQREKQSIESFKKAASQRSGVVELNQEFQSGGTAEMTKEAAVQLINETDQNLIMKMIEKGERANEIEKMTIRKYDEAMKTAFGESIFT